MSLHPSLKIDKAGVSQRSVMTRIERIKELMKKSLWKEDTAVTGLPKTKIIRIKAKKKVKADDTAAPGTEGAAGAPAAAGKPAAAAAKPAAGATKK